MQMMQHAQAMGQGIQGQGLNMGMMGMGQTGGMNVHSQQQGLNLQGMGEPDQGRRQMLQKYVALLTGLDRDTHVQQHVDASITYLAAIEYPAITPIPTSTTATISNGSLDTEQ